MVREQPWGCRDLPGKAGRGGRRERQRVQGGKRGRRVR